MSFGVLIAGFGNVGRAVSVIIAERKEWIRKKYGIDLRIIGAGDSSGVITDRRGINIEKALKFKEERGSLSGCGCGEKEVSSVEEAIETAEPDILVDVSSYDDAFLWHLKALKNGAAVVTSNKPPVALHYGELTKKSKIAGLPYLFEATVMAGTPIIALLRETLLGDRILKVEAVLNATTTFIFTKLENGESFERAVEEAKKMGILESDPRKDLEGIDAAYKAAIIHDVSFGPIAFEKVKREGITDITDRAKNETFRLVARVEKGEVEVKPVPLQKDSPLLVKGTENVAVITTDLLGKLILKGAGGGSRETASGVVSDIIKAARELR